MKYLLILLITISIFGCAATVESRRAWLDQNREEWTELDRDRIARGVVCVGMSKEQCIASWGKPRDINRTTVSDYTREQWVYGKTSSRSYLYFKDGILYAIQN